jgi:fucose 4-O-acetylase-like acetyltransferase
MANKGNTLTSGKRIHWMDNLRTVIIFIVVLYHVGGVYESAGLWAGFWIVDDPATVTWVGIVGIMFDIFIMPTMFLISGYLTSVSLQSKTGWEVIKGKFMRLMIPWVISVITMIPLYKVIFLYSRNLPQQHWTTYFHFSQGNISSQSWLWFLPVLFTFNLIFVLFSKSKIKFPNISMKTAVLGATVIGLLSSFFVGSVLGFRSWTLTPLIDFENERLIMYFLVFLLGALCYRQNVFAEKPQSKKLYTIVNAVSWIPITLHIGARLYPIFYYEGFWVSPVYRLIWWSSFYLGLLGVLYLMIQSFWRYLDKTGKVWRALNRNSYGVYLIHVILIGVFGTLLLNLDLPGVVKYVLLIISTYLGSNLVVSLYRSVARKLKSS